MGWDFSVLQCSAAEADRIIANEGNLVAMPGPPLTADLIEKKVEAARQSSK
jgi:hypothetical protein